MLKGIKKKNPIKPAIVIRIIAKNIKTRLIQPLDFVAPCEESCEVNSCS